jgi:leucyl aminopeptidase (aminopeptidase T)
MTFKQQLENINACKEAREWLQDKTLQEAFTTCERSDWMLWAYARLYPDNLRELTLAKGHCVNTVRHLMKDERSIKAIDAAILFGEGKIDKSELDAANAAAKVAAANATNAAVYAAYVASYAAASAAYAVANAASSYTAKTAAAFVAAQKQSLKEQADICRKYLTL